jgi:hypothetical protein
MRRPTPGNLRRSYVILAQASASWLAGRRSSSRRALFLSLAMHVLATLAAIVAIRWVTLPLIRARAPADLPPDGQDGTRFGLVPSVRREIFRQIASGEPTARIRAAQAFPGAPWSIEDHRASFERDLVRAIAQQRSLNLSQVYLTLDEGIREHWPGPDGNPLSALSSPLSPRRR